MKKFEGTSLVFRSVTWTLTLCMPSTGRFKAGFRLFVFGIILHFVLTSFTSTNISKMCGRCGAYCYK